MSEQLDQKELDEIRNCASRATKGPWGILGHPTGRPIPLGIFAKDKEGKLTPAITFEKDRDQYANFDFAAHARTDLPALLAEIDRQRGVMKEAADALEHYGRNSSLECYCCQHSVGHSEGCIVMRLRTAGEG